jgi:hypothetical protein
MVASYVDFRVLRDPSWWHWAVTVPLVGGALWGYFWCLAAAMTLCGAMAAVYRARLGTWRPFPVQVRLAFLALLLAGALPNLQWVHAVQLAGTTAMVAIGYCPLARLLTLARWNRTAPLSAPLVWHALFVAPRAGGLLRAGTRDAAASGDCCSLRAATCSTAPTSPRRQSTPFSPRRREHVTAASGDDRLRDRRSRA